MFKFVQHIPGYALNEGDVPDEAIVDSWANAQEVKFIADWREQEGFSHFALAPDQGSPLKASLMAVVADHWYVAAFVSVHQYERQGDEPMPSMKLAELNLPVWTPPAEAAEPAPAAPKPVFQYVEYNDRIPANILMRFKFYSFEELASNEHIRARMNHAQFTKMEFGDVINGGVDLIMTIGGEELLAGHITCIEHDGIEDAIAYLVKQVPTRTNSLADIPGVSISENWKKYPDLAQFETKSDPEQPREWVYRDAAERDSFDVYCAEQFEPDYTTMLEQLVSSRGYSFEDHGTYGILVDQFGIKTIVPPDAWIVRDGVSNLGVLTPEAFKERFIELHEVLVKKFMVRPKRTIKLELDGNDPDPLGTARLMLIELGLVDEQDPPVDPLEFGFFESLEQTSDWGGSLDGEKDGDAVITDFQTALMSPETNWDDLIAIGMIARHHGFPTPGQLIEADGSEILDEALRQEDESIMNADRGPGLAAQLRERLDNQPKE